MPISATATIGGSKVPYLSQLRAYDDQGVGHIIPARGVTRHPCGEPVRAERQAWPASTRCLDCIDKAGVVVQR